jgi:SpoVK/Ycf46/Vps4 family AAA+-type ATPase
VATAEQIKSLLRSYSDADGDMFVSIALQIAAHEAKNGKGSLASELKALVNDIREKQRSAKVGGAVPISRPSGELASLLAASYPKTRLIDMILSTEQRTSLEQVLLEYRQQSKLKEHGLSAKRKLLLVGPPGVGKTMTSWALAGELKLPLFSVQFHSLITKFMGETATKLHSIFDAIRTTRGVYLFDEFDAIGAMRSEKNDVGEIRRVLNSFLQFLEQDESDSMIVAATNLEQLLDEALFRRFDEIVRYHLPVEAEIVPLVANRLAAFSVPKASIPRIAKLAVGLSHAEICRACDDAAKIAVLKDLESVSLEVLEAKISDKLRQKLGRSTLI